MESQKGGGYILPWLLLVHGAYTPGWIGFFADANPSLLRWHV